MYLLTANIDGGTACCIDSSHDDLCAEASTLNHCLGIRDDVCIQLVYANILDVDIAYEIVQHLTLSITHIVLQLREQCYSSGRRHILEGILLPVLAENLCFCRHFGGKVAGDDVLLLLVRHHLNDTFAIAIDSFIEFFATTCAGSKHYLCAGFQVFAVLYVIDVGILAIALAYDSLLELLCQVVERVAHAAHILCLLVPFLHLCRVVFHLLVEGAVNAHVGFGGILGTLL